MAGPGASSTWFTAVKLFVAVHERRKLQIFVCDFAIDDRCWTCAKLIGLWEWSHLLMFVDVLFAMNLHTSLYISYINTIVCR